MGRRTTAVGLCAASLALLLAPLSAQGAERGGRCLGRRATIAGTGGDDRIRGTNGPDVILALGGDDVVLGGDGNDRICGGGGIDELHGRYGADRIAAGGSRDVADGGPGNDLLIGGRGADRLSGGDGGADTLVGGRGADSLLGGDGRSDEDFLFGGGDADYLDGGLGGSDRLFPGAGDDTLVGGLVSFEFASSGVAVDLTADGIGRHATGEGADYVAEADGIIGSGHADVIADDDGGHVIRGLGGDDVIAARAGNDRVDGGPGSDQLDGGEGSDFLRFEDSATGVTASLRDGIAEGGDTDSLVAFESIDGSFFDDHLTGDDGPNRIHGSFGTNTLFALGGDDELWFGDEGHAGAGSDTCWSTMLDGCEVFGHADPPPLPFVADPVQGADLDRLETIRGGVSGGIGGPVDSTIVVSIRRMTSNGCWWWEPRRSSFVRGGCETPLRIDVPPLRDGEWALRVGATLRPGAYQVRASWRDRRYGWDRCGGYFAPTCVELRVR